MPSHPARVMRLLKTIDEKLDVALTGHRARIEKLEAGHLDHETRLGVVEQTVRWLVGKIEGRRGPK